MACSFRSLVLLFSYSSWLPGLAGVPSPTEAATPTYGNRPERVASTSSISCSSGFCGSFGVGCYTRERREGEERGSTQFLTEAIALYSASSEEKTLCLRVYFFLIL